MLDHLLARHAAAVGAIRSQCFADIRDRQDSTGQRDAITGQLVRITRTVQAFVMRTQFITLTNLMASDDIRKKTWGPANPARDDMVMPEFMSVTSPADRVAEQISRWLSDDSLRAKNISRLDKLANQYASSGATLRAAEYLLETLRCSSSKPRHAAA